ncbi:MAG: hypothetical protein LBG60_10115 [Bifidobacteriaceae bacterium]|jgi:4-hydroxybutyrate CoA-transferase|nr:hypothetical protein [Bifidobacteriaceae bacterium]
MDWRAHYREHLVTAERAVAHIESGDRVVVHHACAEPTALIDAMVARAEAYSDVEIVHMVPMGRAPYCAPGLEPHFWLNSVFNGGPTRKAIAEGRGDYTPVFFHQFPQLLRTALPVDVALLNVSVPDGRGYCSLGVGVDYSLAAAQAAKKVIAQINPQMPRTLGDCFINVTDLDAIVEVDAPVIELAPPNVSAVEAAIGRNCASLIRDGDCLQLGIGAIPDAVLRELGSFKDLGIHSEMFSDGVVDLVERGVVNNAKKTLHRGKSVATFLMGTRRLYDFVDDNPTVHMAGVDYVNDPRVIGQNDNLVSINSCVQIDLQGQVVSSSVGLRQISGIGGQADFVRGAAMSRGGRSIIACPSTAQGGRISKIVPFIDQGSAVSTMREDVEYVVTEHGIAHLWGLTLRQRAEALIGIAHPDFRDDLVAEYARRFGS